MGKILLTTTNSRSSASKKMTVQLARASEKKGLKKGTEGLKKKFLLFSTMRFGLSHSHSPAECHQRGHGELSVSWLLHCLVYHMAHWPIDNKSAPKIGKMIQKKESQLKWLRNSGKKEKKKNNRSTQQTQNSDFFSTVIFSPWLQPAPGFRSAPRSRRSGR